MTGSQLTALLQQTFVSPRDAIARVLAFDPPRAVRWQLFLLAVVLGVGVFQLSYVLAAPTDDVGTHPGLVFVGGVQAVLLFVSVIVIHGAVFALGGRRGFDDTLLAVSWVQAAMLPVQLGLTFLLSLFPDAGILVFLATGLLFWFLTNAVAELTASATLGRPFLALLIAFLILGFLLAAILGPFAILPAVEGV